MAVYEQFSVVHTSCLLLLNNGILDLENPGANIEMYGEKTRCYYFKFFIKQKCLIPLDIGSRKPKQSLLLNHLQCKKYFYFQLPLVALMVDMGVIELLQL